MNPSWRLQTGRLVLSPVAWSDLADITTLKGDPRAYGVMLGGVRGPARVSEELGHEISDWGRLGYGLWAIRKLQTAEFVGMVGLQSRPDGLGVGMRFALMPQAQGFGYGSEAAAAALRFGHDVVGLLRIVAVAREDNFASRTVLGAIGMTETWTFHRDGVRLIVYASVRAR
eukprot:gene2664-2703_t